MTDTKYLWPDCADPDSDSDVDVNGTPNWILGMRNFSDWILGTDEDSDEEAMAEPEAESTSGTITLPNPRSAP